MYCSPCNTPRLYRFPKSFIPLARRKKLRSALYERLDLPFGKWNFKLIPFDSSSPALSVT